MNKTTLIVIVAAAALLIVAGGSFYGGTLYAKSKNANSRSSFQGQGMPAGITGASKQGNVNIGEIVSKDDNSITIKLANGGSKIIFFSSTTEISKSVNTASDDLVAGKSVSVQGTTNSDGSVTAATIQLRADATPQAPPTEQAPPQ
jgi:hypothetical protein